MGCGQQQGRVGTQAPIESGNKELTGDGATGRGGSSWERWGQQPGWGMSRRKLKGNRQKESLWG